MTLLAFSDMLHALHGEVGRCYWRAHILPFVKARRSRGQRQLIIDTIFHQEVMSTRSRAYGQIEINGGTLEKTAGVFMWSDCMIILPIVPLVVL